MDDCRQSPVEPHDYQGLQLDTRVKEITDKYVDAEKASLAEAEARDLARPSRTSAASTVVSASPTEKRILGLRRRLFWIILALILIIIILAAVIGGVVGASQHSSSAPAPTPSSAPSNTGSPNVTDNGPVKSPES